MATTIKTTCPICNKKLTVSCYRDEAVGIPFDFDVLDASECDCDYDDMDNDTRDKLYDFVQDEYWKDLG